MSSTPTLTPTRCHLIVIVYVLTSVYVSSVYELRLRQPAAATTIHQPTTNAATTHPPTPNHPPPTIHQPPTPPPPLLLLLLQPPSSSPPPPPRSTPVPPLLLLRRQSCEGLRGFLKLASIGSNVLIEAIRWLGYHLNSCLPACHPFYHHSSINPHPQSTHLHHSIVAARPAALPCCCLARRRRRRRPLRV